MKYKPCCVRRCGVGGCKTREQGGCYCICRLIDAIHMTKNIIEGKSFRKNGMIVTPAADLRKEYLPGLTKEAKKVEEELLEEFEAKLKEYELPKSQ
jgi:hypothetical protein